MIFVPFFQMDIYAICQQMKESYRKVREKLNTKCFNNTRKIKTSEQDILKKDCI